MPVKMTVNGQSERNTMCSTFIDRVDDLAEPEEAVSRPSKRVHKPKPKGKAFLSHVGVEQFATRVSVMPMHVHIPGQRKLDSKVVPDRYNPGDIAEDGLAEVPVDTQRTVRKSTMPPSERKTVSAKQRRQTSQCKRHSVDVKSRPVVKSSERLDTEMRLYDRSKKPYIVQKDKLDEVSQQLSHNQVQAFWNAFLLFDHYGTNTISASELSRTLNHVGLKTNLDDIQAIIDAHDDNGNGVLDFEEYLNLMTNPSVFLAMMQGQVNKSASNRPTNFHTPNKPDYRDCLMYEVMNEFFNSKSLAEEEEQAIVGFYAKTMKHISHTKPHQHHAAHVVHHYADGARSLGLTEKEIKKEIEKIKEKQQHETNAKKRNSPYAKPMQMIPRIPKSIEYKKKYDVMSRNNIKEGHLIWRGTPIVNYHVKLPRISVNCDTTFENLKKIRKKASKENNNYRKGLSEVQTGNSRKLWSMLRYKHIPCERLQDVIKEVYGAYTTHVRMQPLGNKPRYVAYSVHDFKTVFPELTDSEDSDDEYFRPSQRNLKTTIRVKK